MIIHNFTFIINFVCSRYVYSQTRCCSLNRNRKSQSSSVVGYIFLLASCMHIPCDLLWRTFLIINYWIIKFNALKCAFALYIWLLNTVSVMECRAYERSGSMVDISTHVCKICRKIIIQKKIYK